jgi:phosphoribosyl-dephospho-CoA transferase
MNWQRHQLVWLNAAGWQAVLAGPADEPPWTASAFDCLQHWSAHGLPLVVTRQPPAQAQAGPVHALPTPATAQAPASVLTLGLAAPLAWSRQRLFVRAPAAAVQAVGGFPPAADITEALPAAVREDWRALCRALQAAGLAAQVYGSHGWQALTGWPCVRQGASDIDLLLPCATLAQADAAVALLAQASAVLPRIDGECVFADGAAVAWREWAAWRAGAARQVLVKRLHGAALVGADTWALAA